jgi:very-short-patch-repair endonuclease
MGESPRHALAQVAERQLGLISTQQVVEAGLSAGYAQFRVVERDWSRIHRGWYRIGVGPMTLDQQILAAQLIAGPAAVISHFTAARRQGLDVPRTQLIDVTVPYPCSGGRYQGTRIFRTRDLRPENINTKLKPYRYTSVERTVLDLAAELTGFWFNALVFSALRLDRDNAFFIEGILRAQGEGKAGALQLRTLLERRANDSALPASVAESFLDDVVQQTDLKPELQYELSPQHHVDFAWPEHKLAVEVDGWGGHSSLLAHQTDRSRDVEATLKGWATLRFTWDDVTKRRKETLAKICQAFTLRTPSSSAA